MTCSGCGAAMRPFLEAQDYNRGTSRERFRYEACRRCGLASLANVPSDLGRYYASGYHAIPASVSDLELGAAHDGYKIELVKRFAAGGRLVEVGPGWGAFCLLARRAGFAVTAIEQDARCCEFLQGHVRVNALQSDDPAAALERTDDADVIALWHVLEHLERPWKVLEAAARRLKAGGVLVIATPNPQALQFRIFGGRWTHLDAPRHVHLIPADLLARRAHALGLAIALNTTRDPGSLGWNDFGWRFSLANLSPAASLRRPMRLAGRILGKLAAPIDAVEGRGAAYTAVFRKPAQ
jgi:2-polyprenyl-3-methyl-5-hydroxy-6-metoxy-1,4-benzoquinol methylase